jgi:Flp pilus assembly pilin Flp
MYKTKTVIWKNGMKYFKGQAIVEYVLIIALTAIVFTSLQDTFDKAIMSFFKMIGNFWSKM